MPTKKHEDTVLSVVSSNGLPAVQPFVLQQIFRTEHCDLEGYEGFWIKARVNLTNDERDALNAANDEVIAWGKERDALPEAERYPDPNDTPYWRQMALCAPFITAWNAAALDEASGEVMPIPPPAEIGVDAFRVIFPEMRDWCRLATLHSYTSGKGLGAFSRVLRALRAPTSDGSDGAPS